MALHSFIIGLESNKVKSSYDMELEGLKKTLEFLIDSQLEVNTLITD